METPGLPFILTVFSHDALIAIYLSILLMIRKVDKILRNDRQRSAHHHTDPAFQLRSYANKNTARTKRTYANPGSNPVLMVFCLSFYVLLL